MSRRNPGAALMLTLLLGAAALVAGAAVASGPRPQAVPPERLPGTAPPPVIVQREPRSVAQLLQGQRDVTEVTVSDGGITPAVLHARVGAELHLHVHNRGRQEHNFLLPAFGIVTQPIAPGGETYIAFTPSRPGSFTYFSVDPLTRTPDPGLEGRLQVDPS